MRGKGRQHYHMYQLLVEVPNAQGWVSFQLILCSGS